jgi:hypothetical protein
MNFGTATSLAGRPLLARVENQMTNLFERMTGIQLVAAETPGDSERRRQGAILEIVNTIF